MYIQFPGFVSQSRKHNCTYLAGVHISHSNECQHATGTSTCKCIDCICPHTDHEYFVWNKCERVYTFNDVMHCVVCAHLLYVCLPLLFSAKCHCAHIQPCTFTRKQCRAVVPFPGCGGATQSQRLTSPSHIRAIFSRHRKPNRNQTTVTPCHITVHTYSHCSHMYTDLCVTTSSCALRMAAQYNNRRVLAAHRLIQQFISFTLILPFCVLYNFSRYYKCAWAV